MKIYKLKKLSSYGTMVKPVTKESHKVYETSFFCNAFKNEIYKPLGTYEKHPEGKHF